MIYHSVFFTLKYPENSTQEQAFFQASQKLSQIPGVLNFQVLKQTSNKNNFTYGLLMEFENQVSYENYSNHQDHVRFIDDFWIKNVADFLEIDYEKLRIKL